MEESINPEKLKKLRELECFKERFIDAVKDIPYYQNDTVSIRDIQKGESYSVCSTLFFRRTEYKRLTDKYEFRRGLVETIDIPQFIVHDESSDVIESKDEDGDEELRFCVVTVFGDIFDIILENATKIYEWCYVQQDCETFGCCNDHIICSDNGACIKNDPLMTKGCWYNRNLIEGKIFYGKNKNI